MKNYTLLPIAFALVTAVGTHGALAQMDVDQADSLNFEGFHKDKKEAVKAWKDDKTKQAETVKAYEQTPATTPAATTPSTATSSTLTTAPVAATGTPAAAYKPGQRIEVRERYTLSRSAKTPYSAFYVIEAMHQQAAKNCPRGWKKLSERSEPIEQDFFVYYEIECL